MLATTSDLALNLALASCLVCLLAWCIRRVLIEAYSALHYKVFLSAIVACALCPLSIASFHLLGVGWLPSTASSRTQPVAETARLSRGAVMHDLPKPFDEALNIVAADQGTQTDADSSPAETNAEPNFETKTSAIPLTNTARPSWTSWIASVLLSLWVGGTALCLVRLLTGLTYLQRLRRGLQAATFEDDSLVRELELRTGIAPAIYESALVSAPLTFGMRRPIMVVPPGLEQTLERHEVLAVLLHECGHIARHDTRATTVQVLAEAFFWWNPLVHYLSRQVRDVREVLCDLYAIGKVETQRSLATGMLKLAVRTCQQPTPSLCEAFIGRTSLIEMRLRRLVDGQVAYKTDQTSKARLVRIFYWPLIACACIPMLVPASRFSQAQDAPNSKTTKTLSADKTNIRGIVKDENGQPLKDVTVWMLLRQPRIAENVRSIVRTQTDATGHFHFELKEKANVTLGATTPTSSWAIKHLYDTDPSEQSLDNTLVLTEPAQLRLKVENELGQPVTGVTLENLSWQVDEETRVWIVPSLAQLSGLGMPLKIEKNEVIIDKLPKHAQYLEFGIAHPDYAMTQVFRGDKLDKVHKVLLKRGYPVHVQVRQSQSQKPLTDQTVEIMYFDKANIQRPISRSFPVDQSGNATFQLSRSLELRISVDHPQYVARKHNHFREWGSEQAGNTVVVELSPRAKVRGRVVDVDTKLPARRAAVGVLITEGEFFSTSVTDENGEYELEAAVGPAKVKIAYGGGYFYDDTAVADVELKADEIVRAPDFFARRIPPVTGTVTLNGRPVENAIVYGEMSSSIPAVTDHLGRFAYRVDSDMLNSVVYVRDVTNNATGTLKINRDQLLSPQPVHVNVKPCGELRGRIAGWDANGKQAREILLRRQVSFGNGRFPSAGITSLAGRCRINSKGEFLFRGLDRDHQYLLILSSEGETKGQFNWIKLDQPVVDLGTLDNVTAADATLEEDVHRDREVTDLEIESTAWHNSAGLTLAQLRGHVVLVVLFDSADPDAMQSMRWLNWLHDQFTTEGLVVIGVHRNSLGFDKVVQFAQAAEVRFPLAVDNAQGTTAQAFGVHRFPETFLFDKEGHRLYPYFDPVSVLNEIQKELEGR